MLEWRFKESRTFSPMLHPFWLIDDGHYWYGPSSRCPLLILYYLIMTLVTWHLLIVALFIEMYFSRAIYSLVFQVNRILVFAQSMTFIWVGIYNRYLFITYSSNKSRWKAPPCHWHVPAIICVTLVYIVYRFLFMLLQISKVFSKWLTWSACTHQFLLWNHQKFSLLY